MTAKSLEAHVRHQPRVAIIDLHGEINAFAEDVLNMAYADAESRKADVILLNTCSIRDKAEQKVFSHLGRLRELKAQREGLQIGVCGCVAQQEGEAILHRAPWVDFVMGPGNVGHLDQILSGDRKVAAQAFETSGFGKLRAFVPGG